METTDEAAVNIEAVRRAKAACEAEILAALNRLEQATGLQAQRVILDGQETDAGGRVLTARAWVELVLR